MENYFEIRPHEGVYNPTFGMIKFGITPEVFTNDLGITGKQRKDWRGDLVIRTDFFGAVFEKETNLFYVIEFEKNAKLFFKGIDLFKDTQAVTKLLKLTDSPLADCESLMFLDWGFIMWGIHKEADGQTVCLFAKGTYDRFLKDYHPYLPGLPEEKS